ncbi:MAG TPA: DUF1992 domain-containing protein [Nocardioides sp.]|nr:DUF1992 domain-containing protein [Nocardioides sp.]
MAEPADDPARARDRRAAEKAAARARIAQQHTWVDLQVQRAIERGEFDDLPGAGKPIEGLGAQHDPDWWVKKLVEREKIAVLPPSLQLRKDDAELDARLDALGSEAEVREQVEEFNARVIHARYTPSDGPPLITMPRDVEETVAAWRTRRDARRAAAAARAASAAAAAPTPRGWRRGWLRRRR